MLVVLQLAEVVHTLLLDRAHELLRWVSVGEVLLLVHVSIVDESFLGALGLIDLLVDSVVAGAGEGFLLVDALGVAPVGGVLLSLKRWLVSVVDSLATWEHLGWVLWLVHAVCTVLLAHGLASGAHRAVAHMMTVRGHLWSHWIAATMAVLLLVPHAGVAVLLLLLVEGVWIVTKWILIEVVVAVGVVALSWVHRLVRVAVAPLLLLLLGKLEVLWGLLLGSELLVADTLLSWWGSVLTGGWPEVTILVADVIVVIGDLVDIESVSLLVSSTAATDLIALLVLKLSGGSLHLFSWRGWVLLSAVLLSRGHWVLLWSHVAHVGWLRGVQVLHGWQVSAWLLLRLNHFLVHVVHSGSALWVASWSGTGSRVSDELVTLEDLGSLENLVVRLLILLHQSLLVRAALLRALVSSLSSWGTLLWLLGLLTVQLHIGLSVGDSEDLGALGWELLGDDSGAHLLHWSLSVEDLVALLGSGLVLLI